MKTDERDLIGTAIQTEGSKQTCQANVSRDMTNYEPCGKTMRFIDDWEWECPKHGPMR